MDCNNDENAFLGSGDITKSINFHARRLRDLLLCFFSLFCVLPSFNKYHKATL